MLVRFCTFENYQYFLMILFSEDNVTQQAKRPKTEKSEDAMDVDEESIADPEFLQVGFYLNII